MNDNRYLSIITNFGCHYKCPYCIVKNNHIDVPKTTIFGLEKLAETIKKYDCNWVSISGGGDPLHEFDKNAYWYYRLFHVVPDGVKFELHTNYISSDWWPDNWFSNSFDRIVYHCHSVSDLDRIAKTREDQIIRAVFVVTEDFTEELIDEIAAAVKNSPVVDELSFRQMVDKHYETTHYCEEYLRAGHKKDWWYIEQNDYNIYYAENEVKFKYEDFCARRN